MSSSGRAPMRLSFYGGGHYDSLADPRASSSSSAELRSAPGLFEAGSIKRLRNLSDRSTCGYRDVLSSSDVEETDRQALEAAIRMSRNEIRANDFDLEQCLAQSIEDYHRLNPLGSALQPVANLLEASEASEIALIQDELERSIAAQSEQEFLEKAIQESLSSQNTTGLVSGPVSSAAQTSSSTEDSEFDAALRLSALSAEEAFQLAMQRSVEYSSNSYIFSHQVCVEDDEDAILQAAINESLLACDSSARKDE